MSSPWVVQGRAQAEVSRAVIERAHEELIAGHEDDPLLQQVRALVRDSWRRSLGNLVGWEASPRLELSGDALEDYRRAHPLAGAMSMIRQLLLPGEERDAGVIVAVGDAAGRLLWVEGDRRVRSRADETGFAEGANWAEECVGTAAPGTALVLGHSVQVHGSEHFNRLARMWSCTAAPVRDLETGDVLGVIDVTGGEPAASPQAQLLVDATARAVENELLLGRMRARQETPSRRRGRAAPCASLSVLGRGRARLELAGETGTRVVELSPRHGEILLMLAFHRQGLTAERLAELVYGSPAAARTLRPEMVRLRRVLGESAHLLLPESNPYRCAPGLETDAHHVLSLLDRGAHRVALAAFGGDVLPASTAPGVAEVRETVGTALREALLTEASADVLLAYTETAAGAGDVDVLRQCLALLPPRSPRRAGVVARLECLGA